MLEALFTPASVAIFGASKEPGKLGHTVLKNVVESGYRGQVYPINPAGGEILGLQAYTRVSEVQGPVDLAVLVVPQPVVLPVMQDLAEKKVKAAIVITAGFREVGPEGAAAEREVAKVAKAGGIRMLGPNVLGIIDTHTPINASFAARMPIKGKIAFMSQSGALLTAVLDWAARREVGFSKVVSLGNKADISEVDLLNEWRDDPTSRVLVAYLEGITDGAAFMAAAEQTARVKPIVVLKAGVTAAGARAVSSHTGSLAGSQAAYKAAFRQSGVIQAATIEDLFDYSIGFANQPLPNGPRVAIVTNSGGPGIIATDAAENTDLTLATLSQNTITRLRQTLPPAAAVYNPVDVLGDARADRYETAIGIVMSDPGVDGLLVLLTPTGTTDTAEVARAIVRATAGSARPVLASFVGAGIDVQPGIEVLTSHGIPNYPFPERAISAFNAMYRYRMWLSKPPSQVIRLPSSRRAAEKVISAAREDGRTSLGDIEARELIAAYGLRTPETRLARTTDEAVKYAEELGYPVVMKIVSPEILHKSDVGGVRVGMKDAEEVRGAFSSILESARRYVPDARIWGVSIQEQVKPGIEVIIGITYDPQFGHLLMFGLGGIYVEVLKDVSFRVLPVTPRDVREMIEEIRAFALLRGVRGQPPADLDAITDTMLKVSQLVSDFPGITEMDVNPLMVYPAGEGAIALDSRIVLASDDKVKELR